MRGFSLFFWFFLLVGLTSCGGEGAGDLYQCKGAQDSSKEARYRVTFTSNWNNENHPVDFPSDKNPHYSPIVVASHSSNYSMWKKGSLASLGVKEVAETGGTTQMKTEFTAAQSEASVCGFSVDAGSLKKSEGAVSFTFRTHEDYPLVSLITMIAPSPDWFVGFSSLSLFDGTKWIDSVTEKAYPWDAGTDAGETYTAPNSPEDEPKNIVEIEEDPFPRVGGELNTLGSFKIQKI